MRFRGYSSNRIRIFSFISAKEILGTTLICLITIIWNLATCEIVLPLDNCVIEGPKWNCAHLFQTPEIQGSMSALMAATQRSS